MNPIRSGLVSSGRLCKACRSHVLEVFKPRTAFEHSRQSSTATRRGKLPTVPARTRFAPSPTGNLHLGSLRTALFNYLLAKRTNGQFLLRIEDTDQKRTVPGAEQRLYDDLRWSGLHWDEGPVVGGQHGPYKQSERLPVYRKHIQTLLQDRKAYRCFCSQQRLDDLNRRRHEKGLSLGYDRKCLDIPSEEAEDRASHGEANVIRFRSPKEWPRYVDLVYGKTGHGAEKTRNLMIDEPVYEDVILIKSDGFPTYHWANICDDHEMKITHVVRGSEWMASTPLHIALYQAFGWTPPAFAHVPLLVDQNRQKLSKRNFDSDLSTFKDSGIFPEALINFAALLGWSHQQKNDVMDLGELSCLFDLKITKGNTIVSFDKLRYLQEQHARRRVVAAGEDFEQMIRDVAVSVLHKYGASTVLAFIGKRKLRDVIASMLQAESMPYHSASDFAESCSVFLDPENPRPLLRVSDTSRLQNLCVAATTLCLVPEEHWTKESHRANMMSLQLLSNDSEANEAERKLWKKDLYHYLRWALVGGVPGPSIPETMEILGRAKCVERIQSANVETQSLETSTSKPNLHQNVASVV